MWINIRLQNRSNAVDLLDSNLDINVLKRQSRSCAIVNFLEATTTYVQISPYKFGHNRKQKANQIKNLKYIPRNQSINRKMN